MRALALFVGIALAAAGPSGAQQPPSAIAQPSAEDLRQEKLDAEMAQKVVGKWTMEIKEKSITGTVVHTYKMEPSQKKGTFEGVAHLTAAGKQKHDISVTGTWIIDKGSIVCTVEKSSSNPPAKGDTITDKIISVAEKELKLRNKKGEDETYKRVVEN